MKKMTVKQKIVKYLTRVTAPKTTKQIAEKTGCNYNTVRRSLGELEKAGHAAWHSVVIKNNRANSAWVFPR